MSFAVSVSLDKSTVQEIKERKDTSFLQETGRKAGRAVLKVLAVLGMILGSALALGGAALSIKFTLASGLMAPLFLFGAACGTGLLYFTGEICSNPVTALGAAFTLPAAGIAYGFPFLLPLAVGALPGAGLISLSSWGWKALSSS